MEVGKKTILNQFIGGNNSTQFVIPIYQRNYVWEKENINQLLSDLEKMIPFIDDDDKYHFLGSIVYIDTLHKGSFNEWTIIDGQQRLTTIFILLQVLRDIFPEYNKVIAKKYLENDEDIINSDREFDRYRLKPLVSDDDVYVKIARNQIEELSQDEKLSNIYKAYITIKKAMLIWKEKYDIETILSALDKFRIVWIQLSKKEDPQQVFESINSTGKGLLAADLIRNFVLMNKDDNEQTQIYNKYWKKIEFINVGTDKLKEFFRFFVSIQEGVTIPEREVYERFKNKYEELLKTQSEESVLNNILSYSNYYYFINKKCEDNEIEEVLVDYRKVKSNMPHLIIMETFKLFYEEKIAKNDLINTIKLLTNYIIRRSVAGEDTKSISNAFGGFLRKILKYYREENLLYFDAVKKAIVADTRLTNQFMPTDNKIRDEFLNSNLYSREQVGFVLKKIENNESNINYANLNIEHIMPQTATDYWKQRIKDNSNYEEVVNKIGNLTLVDYRDNSSMGNKNFENKKDILNKSKHIKMNEPLLIKEDWNEDDINSRSLELAQQFIDIFKYPDIENFDSYKYVNVCEDNIDGLRDSLLSSTPLEVKFNDETNTDFSNWYECQKYLLKKLYELDSKEFIKAVDIIRQNHNYQNVQISYDINEIKNPIEFDEGIYFETNTSTIHKLIYLQRIINNMESDIICEVTYMNEKDG